MTYSQTRFLLPFLCLLGSTLFGQSDYSFSFTPIERNGECFGEIDVNISGNAGDFDIFLLDDSGDSVGELEGFPPGHYSFPIAGDDMLPEGDYVIRIVDGLGCDIENSITIECDCTIPEYVVRQPLCDNENTGSITFGDIPGMFFSVVWDHDPSDPPSLPNNLHGLSSGEYCGEITMTFGLIGGGNTNMTPHCSVHVCITVEEDDCNCRLGFDYFTRIFEDNNITHPSPCGSDGSIMGNKQDYLDLIVWETFPFTATWTHDGNVIKEVIVEENSDADLTISGLSAGIFTLSVADEHCSESVDFELIDEPIEFESEIVHPCPFGSDDGSISIDVSSDMSVSWSTGANGNTISDLVEGSYTATITNASSCENVEEFMLIGDNSPTTLSLSLSETEVPCGVKILIDYAGTRGPFNIYHNSRLVMQEVAQVPDEFVTQISGQNRFRIIDRCNFSSTGTIMLDDEAPFCNEYDVVVTPQLRYLCNTTGGAEVTLDFSSENGCTTDEFVRRYEWSNGRTSNLLPNANPGRYTVTVTDLNDCTATAEFVVEESKRPYIKFPEMEVVPSAGSNPGYVFFTVYGTDFPILVNFNGKSKEVAYSGNTVGFQYLCGNNNSDSEVFNLILESKNGCTNEYDIELDCCNKPLMVNVATPKKNQPCQYPDRIIINEISGGEPPYTVTAHISESLGFPSSWGGAASNTSADGLTWHRKISNPIYSFDDPILVKQVAAEVLLTVEDDCGNIFSQTITTCADCEINSISGNSNEIVELLNGNITLRLDDPCEGGLWDAVDIHLSYNENFFLQNPEFLPITIYWPDNFTTTVIRRHSSIDSEGNVTFSIRATGPTEFEPSNALENNGDMPVIVTRDDATCETLIEFVHVDGERDVIGLDPLSLREYLDAIGLSGIECVYKGSAICNNGCNALGLPRYVDLRDCFTIFSNDIGERAGNWEFVPNLPDDFDIDNGNPCVFGGKLTPTFEYDDDKVVNGSIRVPDDIPVLRHVKSWYGFPGAPTLCADGGLCVFNTVDITGQDLPCVIMAPYCFEPIENTECVNTDGDACCDHEDPNVGVDNDYDECLTDIDIDDPSGTSGGSNEGDICDWGGWKEENFETRETIEPKVFVFNQVPANTKFTINNGSVLGVEVELYEGSLLKYRGYCRQGDSGMKTIQCDGFGVLKLTITPMGDPDADCLTEASTDVWITNCSTQGFQKDDCPETLKVAHNEVAQGFEFQSNLVSNQKNPSVFIGPFSSNSSEFLSSNIFGVTKESVQFMTSNNGSSTLPHSEEEKYSHFAADPGVYNIGGIKMTSWNHYGITNEWTWVQFPEPFTSTPVVLVSQTSQFETTPSFVEIGEVTNGKFKVRLKEKEGEDNIHIPEFFSYMAFEQGHGTFDGKKVFVGMTEQIVNDGWSHIQFPTAPGTSNSIFSSKPNFLALPQTFGTDPAVIRYKNISSRGIDIRLQEDDIFDSETTHSDQAIGYVLIETIFNCDCKSPMESLGISTTDASCALADGSATIIPEGGMSPYTYNLGAGPETLADDGQIADLEGGSYTVTITDSDGCEMIEEFEIGEPAGPVRRCRILERNPNIAIAVGTCEHSWIDKGTTLNDVSLYAYRGTANVSWAWTSSWNNTTSPTRWVFNLRNMVVGVHTAQCVVTDLSSGCETILDFTITVEPQPCDILPVCDSIMDECDGDVSGAITIDEGGYAPYAYLWSDGQSTNPATGLSAGEYTVTVTDSEGCTGEVSCVVENEAAPDRYCQILELNPSKWHSSGVCNFSWTDKGGLLNDIRLYAQSGTAGVSFAWTTNWGGTTNAIGQWFQLDDLDVGVWTAQCVVTDDETGCETVLDFEVEVTASCSVDLECGAIDDVCIGGADGAIEVNVVSGQSPFNYQWSNGQTTNPATRLTAGFYSVTVTDAADCTSTIECEVAELTGGLKCNCSNPITAIDTYIDHPHCGLQDGELLVNISGGTAPFTFAIDGKNGVWVSRWENVISGLSAGTYDLIIYDSGGCEYIETLSFIEDGLLINDIQMTSQGCDTELYSIYVNDIPGGIAPFSYLWSTGSSESYVENVPSGLYTVTVTDNNGCSAIEEMTLADDLVIAADVFHPLCGVDNGSIEVIVSGNAPFTYSWSHGSISSELYGLGEGTYNVTVTDFFGCTVSEEIILEELAYISFDESGGNEGFFDNIFLPAASTLYWDFNPQSVTDQMIITKADGTVLLNTGKVTNRHESCCTIDHCCSDFFLGDHVGTTIALNVGNGFVNTKPGTLSCDGIQLPWAAGLSGSIFIDDNSNLAIEVVPRNCYSGNTGWDLNVSCTGNNPAKIANGLGDDYSLATTLDQLDANAEFKVYPNPTTNKFFVSKYNFDGNYNLNLLDVTGRIALHKNEIIVDRYEFDVTSLPSGVYILNIEFSGRRIIKRLIID